jgi:hypothetical protein
MFNEFEGLVFKCDTLPSISFPFHAPTPKPNAHSDASYSNLSACIRLMKRSPLLQYLCMHPNDEKESVVGVYSRYLGPCSWLYCWFHSTQ